MAHKKKYFRKQTITIAQQAFCLQGMFPNSKVNTTKNFFLTWEGGITPTPLSYTYTIKLDYKLGKMPDIVVLNPSLIRYNNQPLPHVFRGNRLCLFRYKYREWNPEMSLTETIIPWASLWLFYYEIWLSTGKWCGGGEHPKKG